jgi:hypothetical protein
MHRTADKTMYVPKLDCRPMLVEHLDQNTKMIYFMVYLYVVVKT